MNDYADTYQSGSGTPPGNTNAYLTTITYTTVNGVTPHQYFQYAYSDGQVTQSQDDNDLAAGKSTSYLYNDSLRRLTETDYPDGGYVKLAYNDAAPTPSVTTTTLLDSSSNLVETKTKVMDGVGHTTQAQLTTDPDGTDYTDSTYDGLGLLWKQSNPHRSGSLATDGTTTYTYDSLGRTTQVLQPDGSAANTSFSGNCKTVSDAAGKSRKSCSNAIGWLTQVFEDPSGLNYETDYQYNGLTNLIRVDQKGSAPTDSTQWRTRTFQYNSLSELLQSSNPETGTISYTYPE